MAAPVLRSSAQLVSEDQNWTTQVQGTTPEYFDIRNWSVSSGTNITQSDVDGGTKVIVVGQTVAKQLFGAAADPIGQVVRIKNTPYQVIGVLQAKGQSPTGQDYDDAALVPLTTFQTKIQGGLQKFLSGTIFVSAISAGDTSRAQNAITDLLRDRHHIRQSSDDDFSIRNLTEIAGAQQEGTKTMTTLLASIALVSLLVGGIGIMNIMLVSVTERTREIGVRMAVGAKPHHILSQFLVEALTLSVMGGLIGVGIGIGGGRWLASRFAWPILVRPDIIFVSVVFSALVGVGFGLYPARKASRLDPIEALRYE
jgi:putative ABC transport system permease protein